MKRPKTLQHYFNNAWQAFVVEKRPRGFIDLSTTPDGFGRCVYRGPNGEKCGIGVSILDKDYKPEIEGKTAARALALIGYEVPTQDFADGLDAIQGAHDYWRKGNGDFHEWMEKQLRNIAKDCYLTIPKVPNAPATA